MGWPDTYLPSNSVSRAWKSIGECFGIGESLIHPSVHARHCASQMGWPDTYLPSTRAVSMETVGRERTEQFCDAAIQLSGSSTAPGSLARGPS
jgi:hypothetical protein